VITCTNHWALSWASWIQSTPSDPVYLRSIFMLTAFWDTAWCSLVEVDRRFRGTYYTASIIITTVIALKMEVVSISETSVYFIETTPRCIPEGSSPWQPEISHVYAALHPSWLDLPSCRMTSDVQIKTFHACLVSHACFISRPSHLFYLFVLISCEE
jgi:hypothetical protein